MLPSIYALVDTIITVWQLQEGRGSLCHHRGVKQRSWLRGGSERATETDQSLERSARAGLVAPGQRAVGVHHYGRSGRGRLGPGGERWTGRQRKVGRVRLC